MYNHLLFIFTNFTVWRTLPQFFEQPIFPVYMYRFFFEVSFHFYLSIYARLLKQARKFGECMEGYNCVLYKYEKLTKT